MRLSPACPLFAWCETEEMEPGVPARGEMRAVAADRFATAGDGGLQSFYFAGRAREEMSEGGASAPSSTKRQAFHILPASRCACIAPPVANRLRRQNIGLEGRSLVAMGDNTLSVMDIATAGPMV